MSEQDQPSKSLVPHIVIAAGILLVLALIFLWPSEQTPPEPIEVQIEPKVETTLPEPEVVEPEPQTYVEPEPEPIVEPIESEPTPEPAPLDISDAAIKTAVLAISTYEPLGRFLVNQDILRRFVVYTTNLADESIAPNHQVLTPPQTNFRTYQQAGSEWIDSASFKRYTPYVEALENMQTSDLLAVYQTYKAEVQAIYAEIGDPDDDFNLVLQEAIDHILDTPEMPVPVEVYSDSVMYKFKNDRLESLSSPQKQLLRTGPDNMRRIKAKLRELKAAL